MAPIRTAATARMRKLSRGRRKTVSTAERSEEAAGGSRNPRRRHLAVTVEL